MKYLLMMVDDGVAADEPSVPVDTDPPTAWTAEVRRRGVVVSRAGARLRPAREARTVRRDGGRTLVVDGPFADAREQVAGFDLIEATDLDEAIEVAGAHPAARLGPVEIRALWDQDAVLDLPVR